MVEVTHRLNERRQKIRGRIEKSMELIKGHIDELERIIPELSPEVAAHVKEIMGSIEKMAR